ncbi:D-cysteine desulfhydrase [Pseudoscourfieldia marina]
MPAFHTMNTMKSAASAPRAPRSAPAAPRAPAARSGARTIIAQASPSSHGKPIAKAATVASESAVNMETASPEALRAKLQEFGRREYVVHDTPIDAMPRLSQVLDNGVQLFVKRDDLLPLAGGGSKTRKLDYVMQEALDQGADVIVTSGAVQSNHCRLTASAAAREGIECHLVLEERVPGSYDVAAGGNNYTFDLLHAERHAAGLGEVPKVQDELVAKLEAEGKKVYVIPGGASNPLGSVGYARAALEIVEYAEENGPFDAIVTCSGSGGTHSGMLAGLRAAGDQTPVYGISVRFDEKTQKERIHAQYVEVAKLFGNDAPIDDVIIRDDQVGPGYSLPTENMEEALELMACHESILLDPVYTAKGFAGLVAMVREGAFPEGSKVLFLHTGGAPSLYHYRTLRH